MANIDTAGNTTIFFIIEWAKETDFSQVTVKVLWMQLRWMQFHWII